MQQVVIGLARGLSQLDGLEEYYFLSHEEHSDWLKPFLGERCHLLAAKPQQQNTGGIRRIASAFPHAAKRFARRMSRRDLPSRLPTSDGTIESNAIHVMHFPLQTAFLTPIPSIYHPHDLQHLHYPEFFTKEEWSTRELAYRSFCDQASMVTVSSQWNKRDLIRHYGLPSEKIAVIHLAPAIGAYGAPTEEAARRVHDSYGLPPRFVFYPAQTWAHKNHIRLLDAVALLRQEGTRDIALVCSGAKNEHYPVIARRLRELGLEKSVIFTGFVEPEDLNALYQLCHCVVVPTLFEAAGGFGPISEAFLRRRPVACSRVTSLPEEVDDAALLFDPTDVRDIAMSIHRLWTDDALCRQLVDRGGLRVAGYDWVQTTKTFRAHYRRIAHRELAAEDNALLETRSLY